MREYGRDHRDAAGAVPGQPRMCDQQRSVAACNRQDVEGRDPQAGQQGLEAESESESDGAAGVDAGGEMMLRVSINYHELTSPIGFVFVVQYNAKM